LIASGTLGNSGCGFATAWTAMKASPVCSDLRQVDLNDSQPVEKPATSPLSAARRISAVPL
jgi:hypothetical protein